jgi:hypothetical protein
MQKFKIRSTVTWNTGGKRCTASCYQRTGVVTEVVAAWKIPTTYTDGKYTVGSRDHESYVVTVGSHKYWPRVNNLSEKA